jgi:YaiO family outer membrane protein
MKAIWHILVLFALLPAAAFAQQDRFDPDDLFRQARELGFDGKREESRQLCRRILERYPEYRDVQVFMARLYSWDGEYDAARRNLSDVLGRSPDNIDARLALVDVELWSGNPGTALEHSEAGLQSAPAEEGLLYRKAVALNRLERSAEAAQTLELLLVRSPAHRDARALLDSLHKGPRRYRLTGSFTYQRLSAINPWQEGYLSLSRETPRGTVVGRLNYANRFDAKGYQVEFDAYPTIRQGVYAYVNYGYSDGALFPRHRAALEVFTNPGKGLEFSGGFRYLRFSENLWIYTGSAGKYFGNYFVSFRPYITPGGTGTSASGTLMVRRYYSDSDSYIGFSAGAGSAPDDYLSTVDLERLNSWKVGGFASLPVRSGLYWSFGAGWDAEQLPFDRTRSRFTVSTGLTTRF